MALPVTITTQGTVSQGCGGPFISSGGNVYVVLKDDVTTSKFRAFKATDPTSSFSNVGTDPQVTSGLNIQILAAAQDGDNIHVVTCDASVATSVNFRYHVFSMSSDSWTTTNEAIILAINSLVVSNVDIKVRSNGDVVVLYQGAKDAVMGSDYERVDYARRVSGVWTTGVAVDNAGQTQWRVGSSVKGGSDRTHFFFLDNGLNDAYQRTLTSANALETFPAAFNTAVNGGGNAPNHRGTSYDSGGTFKVRQPLEVADYNSVKFDSADAPTVSQDTDITGATAASRLPYRASFSADGTTLWHTFLTDTTLDIYTQSNANDGGWSAPASFYTGTVSEVFTNVYTRGSETVLAMVFMETDPKYHEQVLSTATPTSLIFNPRPFQPFLVR